MRARGLKPHDLRAPGDEVESRPMRARGLKLYAVASPYLYRVSRPMRARGLKPVHLCRSQADVKVAPHAGAWIETYRAGFEYAWNERRAPCGRVD